MAAALATACTATVSGHPAGGATSGRSSVPRSGPDCGRSRVPATVGCLERSLDAYWSRTLHRRFAVHVVLSPSAAGVPHGCRLALRLRTAFTCPIGDRVYLTGHYIDRLRNAVPRSDAWLRFAATLAHETGHVVQFTQHLPDVERQHPTAAQTRVVEQQADCLSGLWAAAVGIPDAQFRRAALAVLRVVDSAFERRTHGSPAQRLAAIGAGQSGGTPRACGVTVR